MKRIRIVKLVLYITCTLVIICSFGYVWSGVGDGVVAFDTDLYLRYQLRLWMHEVPDHFITFNQINMNNEFDFENFRLREKPADEQYQHYSYSFELSNGLELTLQVNHADHFTYEHETIELPESVEDVRDFQATSECRHVRIGDIEYSYVKDSSTGEYKLHGVTMVIDGIQFTWYITDSRYPDEIDFQNVPNSFVERLLHASTATQARDEFAASIRGKHPSQAHRQVLRWGIPAFVVIGLGAFGIIYRRRRKLTSK